MIPKNFRRVWMPVIIFVVVAAASIWWMLQ